MKSFLINVKFVFWTAFDWCAEHKRLTVGVACLVLGLVLAKTVFAAAAEERMIKYDCSREKQTCTISLDDFVWLNANYDAAYAEVQRLRAKKCKYGDA